MWPITRTVVYVLDQNRFTHVNPSFTILKLSIRGYILLVLVCVMNSFMYV